MSASEQVYVINVLIENKTSQVGISSGSGIVGTQTHPKDSASGAYTEVRNNI